MAKKTVKIGKAGKKMPFSVPKKTAAPSGFAKMKNC